MFLIWPRLQFCRAGLTGNPESRKLIQQCPKIIHSLFCLCMDFEPTVAKEALLALVNISADEDGAAILLKEVVRAQ